MSKKNSAILIIITLVAGVVSFFNARITALRAQNQASESSQQWLQDVPETITEAEAKFNIEADKLISNLQSLQNSLASVIEDPCTPDEIVLEHVDEVIDAHEHLIRRVGEHVVRLRNELSENNRERLMQLCAEAVSGPMSRLGAQMGGPGGREGQGRRGYGYGRQGQGGRGYGYRGGSGQGGGPGYGQRFRFMDRLTNRLRLTSEQVILLQENDPNFESESINLYNELMAERQKLLSVFENPQSSDEELLEQIDSLISTHSRIERRIAEHVLILRPYLTVEQQRWLIGLCRRSETSQ